MKLSFNLQTLVLVVLGSVLTVATLVWASVVYGSLYGAIINGFDRKLLALSGAAGALVDGEAHADFQRPHRLVSLTAGPAGQLLGFDEERRQLMTITVADGGALPLGAPRTESEQVLGLVYLPAAAKILVLQLGAAGWSLQEYAAADGARGRTLPLPGPLEGVLRRGEDVVGWSGQDLFRVELGTGQLTPLGVRLARPVRALQAREPGAGWLGLDLKQPQLVTFDAQGALGPVVSLFASEEKPATLAAEGAALGAAADGPTAAATPAASAVPAAKEPAPELAALAWAEGSLYAAGPSLLNVQPATGQVARGDFYMGYFSEQHPFVERYGPAFRAIREAAGLTFLYTLVYQGSPKIYYALDGTVGDDHSPPGYEDELEAETAGGAQMVSGMGKPFVSDIQKWELWGLIKVALSPIKNAEGQTVAMAGADVNITIIRQKVRWALFAVLMLGVGSIVLAAGVSVKVSQALTRPVQELKDSALWIAAGYFGTPVQTRDTLELKQLSASLGSLSASLESQDKRARSYQSRLQTERSHAALRSALTDLAAPYTQSPWLPAAAGGPGPEEGQPSASCWLGQRGLFWLAPPAGSGLAGACLRARVTLVARRLLTGAFMPGERLARLLRAAPALIGVGEWDAAAGRLDYAWAGGPLGLVLFSPEGGVEVRVPKAQGNVTLAVGQHLLWTGFAWTPDAAAALAALVQRQTLGSAMFWAELQALAEARGLTPAHPGFLFGGATSLSPVTAGSTAPTHAGPAST